LLFKSIFVFCCAKIGCINHGMLLSHNPVSRGLDMDCGPKEIYWPVHCASRIIVDCRIVTVYPVRNPVSSMSMRAGALFLIAPERDHLLGTPTL
jgi:hypothetical protein